MNDIQGDSGRKVSILEGDSTGHCEKKVQIDMLLILNVYRETAVGIYKCKSNVNGIKE